jgi:hypothetical protein
LNHLHVILNKAKTHECCKPVAVDKGMLRHRVPFVVPRVGPYTDFIRKASLSTQKDYLFSLTQEDLPRIRSLRILQYQSRYLADIQT